MLTFKNKESKIFLFLTIYLLNQINAAQAYMKNKGGHSRSKVRSKLEKIQDSLSAHLMISNKHSVLLSSRSCDTIDAFSFSKEYSTPPEVKLDGTLIKRKKQLDNFPYRVMKSCRNSLNTPISSIKARKKSKLKDSLPGGKNFEYSESTQSPHPVTQLSIPQDIYSSLTGTEFESPEIVSHLCQTGYNACLSNEDWKPDSKSEKLLTSLADRNNLQKALQEKKETVLLWTRNISDKSHYGSHLPMIKTRGIISNMSPRDIATLLMDSSKVKLYNKVSLGRTDVITYSNDEDTEHEESETKIVENLTKPPLVKKPVKFRTMMHARRLNNNNDYIVVSRAVANINSNNNEEDEYLKSEILLGVNLLQQVPNTDSNEILTDMISITHVNSPFVHPFVAVKAGLKGAVDFFNDIRALSQS